MTGKHSTFNIQHSTPNPQKGVGRAALTSKLSVECRMLNVSPFAEEAR